MDIFAWLGLGIYTFGKCVKDISNANVPEYQRMTAAERSNIEYMEYMKENSTEKMMERAKQKAREREKLEEEQRRIEAAKTPEQRAKEKEEKRQRELAEFKKEFYDMLSKYQKPKEDK